MQAESNPTMTMQEAPDFTSLHALQSHIRKSHPPVCEECGSQFTKPWDLRNHHDAQHKGLTVNERRKFPCLESGCGRSFTARNNLAAHVKNFHRHPKAFICGNEDLRDSNRLSNWDGSNACGRSFSTKGNLVEHVRTSHLGFELSRKTNKLRNPTSFKTQIPISKERLDLLRLTGSGYGSGRKFDCPSQDCSSRFTRQDELHRHIEIYHASKSRIPKVPEQKPTLSGDRLMDLSTYQLSRRSRLIRL